MIDQKQPSGKKVFYLAKQKHGAGENVRKIKIIKKTIKKKYRVSMKSFYNLKKVLQSEMIRYRNEGCFMLISIS